MNTLISLGPIIGIVIFVAYSSLVKIYQMFKGKKQSWKKIKNLYIVLIAIEFLLICISIFVPKITGNNYLTEGMSANARVVITPSTFKVAYEESRRNYSNRILLQEEELKNVQAICSVDEGKVFLRITQDNIQTIVDITNQETLLNLSEYKEGNIRFTLINEDAKNVNFELLW